VSPLSRALDHSSARTLPRARGVGAPRRADARASERESPERAYPDSVRDCVIQAAFAVLLVVACGGEGQGVPDVRPNILLISLDTVRADHLGCYGYARDTSPQIDRLASEGVLFEHAVASAPWTIPSHASLLTGLYARRHRIHLAGQSLPAHFETLATRLVADGYATAAAVNVGILENLLVGFDRSWIVPAREGHSDDVFELVSSWLASASLPYFVFLHVYDAHTPYAPDPEFAALFEEPYDGVASGSVGEVRRLMLGELELGPDDARHMRNLYDGEIRQLDASLGSFLERLGTAGHLDRTIVALVSDHGEEFYDHGGFGHGHTLYQELVRVPFILSGPGIPRGVRVATPVSLVGVAATLLALAGSPPLEGVDGADLSPHWLRPAVPLRAAPAYSEADFWLGNKERNFRRSVRSGRYTLHYDAKSAQYTLYDLEQDPTQAADLSSRRPGVMDRLRSLLADYVPAGLGPPPTPPSEEMVESMKALGYLEVEEPAP